MYSTGFCKSRSLNESSIGLLGEIMVEVWQGALRKRFWVLGFGLGYILEFI